MVVSHKQETKLLSSACEGRGWDLLLCNTGTISFAGSGGVTVPRCSGDPLLRLGTGAAILLLGLALAWAPGQRALPRLLGPSIVAMQPFIMWAMQPAAARLSASPPAYYIVTSLLGGLTLASEVMRLRRGRAAVTPPHLPAQTSAAFSFSVSGATPDNKNHLL